ncbi:hypothetical protein CBS101457_001587 [Exobasidium rhododendri]|nr:hypothetical protein CBS101457_001587 [Exobasidium rhododendri]
MTEQQQSQQAAGGAPLMSTSTAAPSLSLQQQQHRNQESLTLSFDDEPLIETSFNGVPDDYFSSPEWNNLTDPSPALTTSMSFYNTSCDTSPLLTDNYDAPYLSGLPLFDDFDSHALYSSTEHAPSPKRSPQNAFCRAKAVPEEESAMLLLRALNNHSKETLKARMDSTQLAATTASPSAISSPLPSSTLVSRPSLSNSFSSSSLISVLELQRTEQPAASFRGTKRRIGTSDLLPIDAPIQPRTYKTPSATSRKEIAESSFAAEEAAIAAEKNPSLAKRLSNTLAARRSRHRKLEEKQAMLDEIEEEKANAEMWKKRCLRSEEELDRARAQGFI